MKIISEEIKNGTLFLKINIKYNSLSLDDKLALCREYRADWWGAVDKEDGCVILLRLRKNAKK